MRSKTLTFIILCFLSIHAAQARTKWKNALEWGPTIPFYMTCHYYYIASEGYRINYKGQELDPDVNTHIAVRTGLDFGRRSNISLVAGYTGAQTGVPMFPVEMRYTFYMKGTDSDGLFFNMSAGPGFKIRRTAALAELGSGWRIRLSPKKSLDLSFSLQGVGDSPVLYDEDTGMQIPMSDVQTSLAVYIDANFSLALVF